MMSAVLQQRLCMSGNLCASTVWLCHRTICATAKGTRVDDNVPVPHNFPGVEERLRPYRRAVQEQGNLVRNLKETNAAKDTLSDAIAELKQRKQLLKENELQLCTAVEPVDKAKLDDLLKQRFFYDQSFSIYGGLQGLYDYGPMGCAVKSNFLHQWRQFFVLADCMLEVDCPILTPESVLKASGHVERFTDYLVGDSLTGETFRADHLVKRCLEAALANPKASPELRRDAKAALQSVDTMDDRELQRTIDRFGIRAPGTGNELTPPRQFNLMLETRVGSPAASHRVYLRPETAQGMFVNFKRLLDTNRGRLPMAVAQIGACFRNEIAPRSGLTRLREFALAEIEHFYDPQDSGHPNFASVADLSLPLLSAADQDSGSDSVTWRRLGDAVASAGGPIANETLGYYLGRIHAFLTDRCGVDPRRLRFRQHRRREMAHYACDCWDAECLMASLGWVECVGCADRSAYDLTRHGVASGERLTAEREKVAATRDEEMKEAAVFVVNRAALANTFDMADARQVSAHLSALPQSELRSLAQQLDQQRASPVAVKIGATEFRLPSDALSLSPRRCTEELVPCVVEPSFGVGRILSAVLEHNFRSRPGPGSARRTYLSLLPHLAPYTCAILPMSHPTQEMSRLVQRLSSDLARSGLAHTVDATSGASIGKRYARNDQIGVPFAVTVDFESACTPEPTVTLRERDSMRQVRVEVAKLPGILQQLISQSVTWHEIMKLHQPVDQADTIVEK